MRPTASAFQWKNPDLGNDEGIAEWGRVEAMMSGNDEAGTRGTASKATDKHLTGKTAWLHVRVKMAACQKAKLCILPPDVVGGSLTR